MRTNNLWSMVKRRYRLPQTVQLSFEMGFPRFLIGDCRLTADGCNAVKTKKISLSMKGIVLSDTLPLSWFTSSVFIPWKTALDVHLSNDAQRCRLHVDDPLPMTIDLPWSKAFTDYAQQYDNRFHVNVTY